MVGQKKAVTDIQAQGKSARYPIESSRLGFQGHTGFGA